jgi:hypothetical protein
MQPEQGHPRTHLFTVRLWVEPFADDQYEVRMQVKHVLGGETRYFRAWPDVETFLLAKLQELEAANRRGEGDHGVIHDFRE